MLLVLDNYDSFTYNLVQYLEDLGAETRTVRNDELTVDDAVALDPERVVISPGPGTPDRAGISLALIERLAGAETVCSSCQEKPPDWTMRASAAALVSAEPAAIAAT